MRSLTFTALITALLALGMQAASAGDAAAGETKFKQLCSTCHGPAGKGDGPAAAGLRPRPPDMSKTEWQASVDDEFIRAITRDGGAAVGRSPMMTPWGHALSEADLDNLVAYIRSLAD